MTQILKFLLRLVIALVTMRPQNAKQKMLIDLLGDAFEIVVPKNTPIDSLAVTDYARQMFKENDIHTVGEALRAYSLGIKMVGVGEKSWEDFFEAARGRTSATTNQ